MWGLELGGFQDAIEHRAKLGGVGQTEIHVGDFMFEFGWEFETTAQQDQRMAVGLSDAQDILEATDQHGVGLVEVELEIAKQHDVARAVAGEKPVEKLQNFQRVRAWGDATFLGIDQALG